MDTAVSVLLLSVMLGQEFHITREMLAKMARGQNMTETEACRELLDMVGMVTHVANAATPWFSNN